jgi:hypothetical protein
MAVHFADLSLFRKRKFGMTVRQAADAGNSLTSICHDLFTIAPGRSHAGRDEIRILWRDNRDGWHAVHGPGMRHGDEDLEWDGRQLE